MRKIWMAVLALSLSPALASATPFTVDAFWNSSSGGTGVNTGFFFNAGDLFTVNVNPGDLWSAGALPRWSNADGLTATNRYATGSDDSLQPFGTLIGGDYFGLHTQGTLSAPFGTLVGSIGGTFFKIGTSFAGPAPASGTLLLYYWDSNFEDNTQFITANVAPVPEPASLLLVGSGLLGLALRRRRRP